MIEEYLWRKGFTPMQLRLYSGLLKELEEGYLGWERETTAEPEEPFFPFVRYLFFVIQRQMDNVGVLQSGLDKFNADYSRSLTDIERRQLILKYAAELGARGRQWREDRRALNRWLGLDAMQERCMVRIARTEQKICLCLERLGFAFSEAPLGFENQLELSEAMETLLNYSGNEKIPWWTLQVMARILDILPVPERPSFFNQEIMQKVYRFSMDEKQSVIIQGEAMNVLLMIDIETFVRVARLKLAQRELPDAIFIRKYCLRMVGENLEHNPALETLIFAAADEPSPFVRQELAGVVCHATHAIFYEFSRFLSLEDPSPQVRAMMLLQMGKKLEKGLDLEHISTLLSKVMSQEKDEFVLRTAVHVVKSSALKMMAVVPEQATRWCADIQLPLKTLHLSSTSLLIRRFAAQVLEILWMLLNREAHELKKQLEYHAADIPQGASKIMPRDFFLGYDDVILGRVMALVAQQDFGLSLQLGKWWTELYRGPEFRFRWWRFIHEMRHASPDKRQAFSHNRGRYFYGQIHSPSPIVAEQTETKVPGEPQIMPQEQGWRPYLPLVDHLLSTLKVWGKAETHTLYTAEGMTTITPPPSLYKRLSVRFHLTTHFPHYATLRNWKEEQQEPPDTYVKGLRKLGFAITFKPYEGQADHTVTRFFSGLAFPSIMALWERLRDYFVSIYENSFIELIIFTLVAIIIFLGRNLYVNARQRRLRKRIPLVMGGWGTRGKSGTERLKAALINSLGFGVVSKTTGSEATFLHAWPMGELYEIPLFRPYDKATIWEQQDVSRIAANLGVEVLLWECMALQPDYVGVLQHDWMKDDFSTLTNAFPDHEDVMGPAGINVPEVMVRFIPSNTTLFTSEELMLPILREGAKKQNTTVKGVGWLEAGLLTPDVLARFPYSEHPYNIVLVLALAQELGIDRDLAIKEMADRVVSEIGMLKTYPLAKIKTRNLEFTNGMAANERVGCLSNWQRKGFDIQDYETEPGVFLSTVVNNRADRIPRSKVFAAILAQDLSADRHFLIGSNLTGLAGYIREAWDEYAAGISLFPGTTEGGKEILDKMVKRLRLTVTPEHIQARLMIMLNAVLTRIPVPTGKKEIPTPPQVETLMTLWEQPEELGKQLNAAGCLAELVEDVVKNVAEFLLTAQQYREFLQRVNSVGRSAVAVLDEEFRRLLWQWFEKKIKVIPDFHAPGDAVIQRIYRETPPGFSNRIIGIQNIKGTGFDFVMRWQYWDQFYKAITLAKSPDSAEVEKGMGQLVGYHGYGLLSEEEMMAFLPLFRVSLAAQSERIQAQWMIINNQFERRMKEVNELLEQEHGHKSLFLRILDWVEGFLDSGDAVKRKKTALRIYADLIGQRISHPRAIQELNLLNKRQKGGWLSSQVRRALDAFK